jgi:hypothetical protein
MQQWWPVAVAVVVAMMGVVAVLDEGAAEVTAPALTQTATTSVIAVAVEEEEEEEEKLCRTAVWMIRLVMFAAAAAASVVGVVKIVAVGIWLLCGWQHNTCTLGCWSTPRTGEMLLPGSVRVDTLNACLGVAKAM